MVITDDLQEIFDVVDINDNVVGRASRAECNSNPDLIHRSVFILIFDAQNRILWQKRSPGKDTNPGHWTTSVSGHADSGESYEQAAVREAEEELGIRPELEFLGKFLFRYPNESEYSAIYKARSNGPFRYNEKEISAIMFSSLSDMLRMERDGKLKLVKPVHYIIDSLELERTNN